MSNLLRNAYKNLTLRNKILILNALVIICSLTVLAFFANRISGDAIMEKATNSSNRELQLIDSNLDAMISNVEDYARVISTNDKLQEYLMALYKKTRENNESVIPVLLKNEMSRIVRNIISPNTKIISISVYVENQLAYSDRFVDDSRIPIVITESFLNEAYEYQKPLWSDLFELIHSDGRKEMTFAVAKLVIDLDTGNKTGTIVLYISEEDISRIYTKNSSNAVDRYYVLNSDNFIISSRDKTDLNKNAIDVISIEKGSFDELLQDGGLTVVEGNDVLMSVQNFDRMGWKIISLTSLDEITRERLNIQKVIFVVGILCLIFAFIFSYLISYTVTKPVQKLSKTMKQIMAGNMDVRADNESNSDIGVLTLGFNNLMDKIQKLLKDIVIEQKAKQEYEFKLIQSQIKPHFLYNSLETIISLNKLERYDEATMVTKSLAGFYRLSLSKGNDVIKISDEIQLITDYLFIQKKRYSNYMDFTLEVEENILEYYIPKLTLQPLVENSIYHGLKYKNNKGSLNIKGYLEDGKIILVVFDEGVGIPEEKINLLLSSQTRSDNKEDFGLASVDRRIKLLYGGEYGLRIESEIGLYTRVFVTIPLLKSKKKAEALG